ncbi:MAG: hypothetical protein RIM23_31015 [Coleofasciculus sp. G3-WIS-01]|uniref:hypothetical protein n=1 Tax=Coleofasciculus sp. G3-WIS-01 TaxID=3069528 RepID=UPI0033033CA6
MSDSIIYPSIDLFLYDLKEGLGQNANQIDQNRRQFWQKVYGDLDEKSFEETYTKLSPTQTLDSGIISLLETRYRYFPDPFDGYYEPLELNDTYALQVDYSGKLDANNQSNDQPQPLHDKPFFHLKQELIQRLSQQTGIRGDSTRDSRY